MVCQFITVMAPLGTAAGYHDEHSDEHPWSVVSAGLIASHQSAVIGANGRSQQVMVAYTLQRHIPVRLVKSPADTEKVTPFPLSS